MNYTFMQKAFEEAEFGMLHNHGGPFGAVLCKENKIISKAHNEVLLSNDPTAHAEIMAIRKASQHLERFNLSDCILYSTCEPCPMCYSAIHWARIPIVYYAATRYDAARAGFDDELLYQELKGELKVSPCQKIEMKYSPAVDLFETWINKEDKQNY
jgi:guanine deaminase